MERGTPHEQYYSWEVKLCTKGGHALAMIHHSAIATRPYQFEKLGWNSPEVPSKSQPEGEVSINILEH